MSILKGAVCSFGEETKHTNTEFENYNIKGVIKETQKYY